MKLTMILMLVVVSISSGCALHYYDAKAGTEHLWGFGHLKMRAAPQAVSDPAITNAAVAFVTGVRTLGLNLSAGEQSSGLSMGWDARSRVIIRADDAQFYLLWPSNSIWLPWALNDVFTIRVGTNFPHYTNPIPRKTP